MSSCITTQASGVYIRPGSCSLKYNASFQVNDHVDNNNDDKIYFTILMEVIMHGRYGNYFFYN